MGLDMNAYKTKHDIKDYEFEQPQDSDEFRYWRKFNNLHGWMEKLYTQKGGMDKFNCINLRLTQEDINNLRKDALSLKPVKGFFFGQQHEMDSELVRDVLDFCNECDLFFEEGYNVFYASWW